MKFPLTGKYSSGEALLKDGKWYFRKTITLPNNADPHKTLESILEYRSQLEAFGIKTTKLYSSRVENGKIVLIEKFYKKNLEISMGISSSRIANEFFNRLLNIVDQAYDDETPKIVVEIKPSNFLVNGDDLFYCDFIPPRVYSANLDKIKLEFYKKPISKIRKLRYRFLTKEGTYYYLLLHTIPIRPSLSRQFTESTLAAIKNPKLRSRLRALISSEEFISEEKRFEKFYQTRRKAYNEFNKRWKNGL